MAAYSKPIRKIVAEEGVLDWDDNEQVTRAFARGVAAALREHKENGWYVVTAGPDGKPVEVPPEDIVVPEVE